MSRQPKSSRRTQELFGDAARRSGQLSFCHGRTQKAAGAFPRGLYLVMLYSSIACASAALSISSASSVTAALFPVAFSQALSMACRVAASARPVSSRP